MPAMSPEVCPPPPDCPLYAERLTYAQDEPLRRAVLMERRKSTDLGELIHAEAARSASVPSAALPPASPVPTGVFQKGVTHA